MLRFPAAALAALVAASAVPARAQTAPTLEQAQTAARRTLQSAEPVLGDDWDDGPALVGDLPNFHEVEPGVYRLAQPTRAGVRRLKAEYHVRTILNLRLAVPHGEAEEAAKPPRIDIKNVKMNGILMPTFHEVDRAVAVLADPTLRPVAVHCYHGRDRTGVAVAAYEVAVRGKDAAEAADEAASIGCCPPTFGVPLERYLRAYKRHFDGDPLAVEPRPSSR